MCVSFNLIGRMPNIFKSIEFKVNNGLTIGQQQIQTLSADKIGQLQDLLKPVPIDNFQMKK